LPPLLLTRRHDLPSRPTPPGSDRKKPSSGEARPRNLIGTGPTLKSLEDFYSLPPDHFGRIKLSPQQTTALFECVKRHINELHPNRNLTKEEDGAGIYAVFANVLASLGRPKIGVTQRGVFAMCAPEGAEKSEKKAFGDLVAAIVENATVSRPHPRLLVQGRAGPKLRPASPQFMAKKLRQHELAMRALISDWHVLYAFDKDAASRLLSEPPRPHLTSSTQPVPTSMLFGPLRPGTVPNSHDGLHPLEVLANRLGAEADNFASEQKSAGGRPKDFDTRALVANLVSAYFEHFGKVPTKVKGGAFEELLTYIFQGLGIPAGANTVARAAGKGIEDFRQSRGAVSPPSGKSKKRSKPQISAP